MRKMLFGIIRKVYQQTKFFLDRAYENNIAALSAQSALFLLLSSVPLLMFISALIMILTGLTIGDDTLQMVLDTDNAIILYLRDYIIETAQRATSGTAIITAILALWSAGRGMYCITEGISRIYRLPNKHVWLLKRIFSMGYTIVMIFLMIIGFIMFLANILVSRTFESIFGGSVLLRWLTGILNPVVLGVLQILIMIFALKFFLRGKVKEKRYYSFRALLPGVVLTVIAWNALSLGVSLYIRYFSGSSIYGSLGTLAILIIWVYFMMFILLYGIQLNYIYRDVFSKSRKKKKQISENNS